MAENQEFVIILDTKPFLYSHAILVFSPLADKYKQQKMLTSQRCCVRKGAVAVTDLDTDGPLLSQLYGNYVAAHIYCLTCQTMKEMM
jgi:hypothetical protein